MLSFFVWSISFSLSFFTLFDLSLCVCGVGCFFLPFLSFSFLFSLFLFKLWVHLMWSFCDFFGESVAVHCIFHPCIYRLSFALRLKYGLEVFSGLGTWQFRAQGHPLKQEFFSLLIFFSPWNWVCNRKSSIYWKRSIYIAFLVSAEFQVGIYKKLCLVGLMITQRSLNLCLAYSSSCRASLCWFYFNLGPKWLCKSAELFTINYLFLICTEPLPFRLGKMSTIGKVITCKGT